MKKSTIFLIFIAIVAILILLYFVFGISETQIATDGVSAVSSGGGVSAGGGISQ